MRSHFLWNCTPDKGSSGLSKSLGNTISPDDVIKQYGADILRLWVSQSDYTSDLRIGKEILKGVADSYRRLRNSMRFMLGSLGDFKNISEIQLNEKPNMDYNLKMVFYLLNNHIHLYLLAKEL